jgi:hypothetical protein
MGGDDPIVPPPLEDIVNALKELAYHATGGGATESHRARLFAAALAFLQILHGDGQTIRYVKITWKILVGAGRGSGWLEEINQPLSI